MQKLQSTYVKTDIGKIPTDWKLYKLQDITFKITDGTHKTPSYLDKGIPFLRVTDIQNDEINWNEVKRISSSEHQELLKRCKPEKGDILLSKNGTIGITKLINWEEQFSIFVSLCLIKPNHEIINNKFLSYILRSDVCFNQMELRSKQGTVTNLHLEEIRELSIPTPSSKEQQKIASILSSVDELIQKTEQIIEQTQRLKKGLMQRLLTKGIEHTKFKNVNLGINFLNYDIPSEWKLLKLGDIASVHGRIGWKGLKREEYTETGSLMLSVWSLIDDDPYGVDYTVGVNRLSKFRYDESPEIKLQNGDVLLAKDGDIGRIGYVKSLPEPSTVNSHVVVVRTKNNMIDSEFLYWYMNAHPFQSYCKSLTSGTTVPLLSQSNIREAKISIPSLEEQNVISSILYTFSNIIYKNKIYKNKIEDLKKGLMQQLLTGKIRVKV